MKRIAILALVGTAALAACGSEPEATQEPAPVEPAPRTASATLHDAEGTEVGTATITERPDGLFVSMTVHDMTPGEHGAHIHTTGDCSATDFTSAGGHWNPGNTNHGKDSEAPNPHAGDLPNLEVAESGGGILEAGSSGTFDELFDDDGAAIVIHADPDDYKSQPSGNAGDRIACGVIEQG
jgi:Cu-Zn family superoxide dismutase